MKFRIQAGAEIDTITPREMADVLEADRRSWVKEVSRGDTYRTFSAQGTIAAGVLQIGGDLPGGELLGPGEGFVWAVQRIALEGLTTYAGAPLVATTEPVRLFVNGTQPGDLVHPAIVASHQWTPFGLVLRPGDRLIVRSPAAGLTSTGIVTLTGQARELPRSLAWRLGG